MRSTDSATLALGFAGENLDTTALANFGGSTGTVNTATWYDQQGSANFTETTAANRPRVRSTTANDTRNGKVAMLCASAVGMTGAVSASTIQSFSFVCSINNNSNGQLTAPSANGGISVRINATSKFVEVIKQGTGVLATSTIALTISQLATVLVTINTTTGDWAIWVDGAAAGSGNAAGFTTLTAGLTTTLARAASANIHIGEAIFLPTVLGSADRATLQANQKAYWGTP